MSCFYYKRQYYHCCCLFKKNLIVLCLFFHQLSVTTKTEEDDISTQYTLDPTGKIVSQKPSHLGCGKIVITQIFVSLNREKNN